jgi:serine/threonine protein kinase
VHAQRIVHRDIKPENVLMSHLGIAKLADLGVARRFEAGESSQVAETHGTYHFFAPEMTTGRRYDAYMADVWALSLTFFIYATGGVVPFMPPPGTSSDSPEAGAAQLFARIGAHTKGSLPFGQRGTAATDAQLRQLLDDMLDPNPHTRLTLEQIRVRLRRTHRTHTHTMQCVARRARIEWEMRLTHLMD